MSQRLQVLLYGAPTPNREDFWRANPDADEDPIHEGLYALCHGRQRKRGDVTLTDPDQSPRLIGVCLTPAYEHTTLQIGAEIVDEAIRAEWSEVETGAERVGVDLGEPAVWLCVVEVA